MIVLGVIIGAPFVLLFVFSPTIYSEVRRYFRYMNKVRVEDHMEFLTSTLMTIIMLEVFIIVGWTSGTSAVERVEYCIANNITKCGVI